MPICSLFSLGFKFDYGLKHLREKRLAFSGVQFRRHVFFFSCRKPKGNPSADDINIQ